MNKIKRCCLLILIYCNLVCLHTATAQQSMIIRTGNHNLSLQWISWEKMGTVHISAPDKNGIRTIKGAQRSDNNEDYLEIEGTLLESASRELLFKGTILIRVAGINNGQLCKREGT